MKSLIKIKTKKKSIFNSFFAFCLLFFCFLPLDIFAQGGTIGPLTWKLENGTLTISGKGDMPNFDWFDKTPWWNFNYKSTLVIEDEVTSIGKFSFTASNITSANIGNSVTKIGPYAFDLCTGLTSMTIRNPIPPSIDLPNFGEVNISACTLKVPIASVSAYQRAEVWKEFNIIGIEVGITEPDPKSGSGDQLVLYPNPSTGTCNIIIPEEFLLESSLTLSIYDNSGKLLQQIPIENEAESFNVQLEHRAAGVYPVVLSNGRKSYRGKIVFK